MSSAVLAFLFQGDARSLLRHVPATMQYQNRAIRADLNAIGYDTHVTSHGIRYGAACDLTNLPAGI